MSVLFITEDRDIRKLADSEIIVPAFYLKPFNNNDEEYLPLIYEDFHLLPPKTLSSSTPLFRRVPKNPTRK